jgi:Na+-transporting NADH:ubiquinone oxidoreductase subunit A
MGKFIRLKKGFTINLQGKASPKVVEIDQPETFVIKPTDFQGLYMPKPTVNVGGYR